jgi:excisionase family DNA binding protein
LQLQIFSVILTPENLAGGFMPQNISQTFSLDDFTPELLAQFQASRVRSKGKPKAALRLGRQPEIQLPNALVELLVQALSQAAAGKKVSLIDEDEMISPEKAAALLQVSRPFLVKQLEAGAMPFHWVGSHRRLRLADVITYRQERTEKSYSALKQMREEAEELGLYE